LLQAIIGAANQRSKARRLRGVHACHGGQRCAWRWAGEMRRRSTRGVVAIAYASSSWRYAAAN
jgi:hypothetical protein